MVPVRGAPVLFGETTKLTGLSPRCGIGVAMVIPIKGTLTVNADVMLGTSTLKEGTYNYRCDRENITFANPHSGKTILKVPCKGRELPAPIEVTTMVVKIDASGKRVVTKLLLKGSNIEHVFQ